MNYARRPIRTLVVVAASTLAAAVAIGSAASAAPTATPTPTPSPEAYPLRDRYVFETHVKYVNYPYGYALANNYVQCRIDLGKYFYGDNLSPTVLKPSGAPSAQPTVSYTANERVIVVKSTNNTVPSAVTSLTYSCTLLGTGANGSQVYLPNVAPIGPGSVLYVTGTFAPNRPLIDVVQPLVLNGPTPAPQMQPVRQPSNTTRTSSPPPLPNGTVTAPPPR